MAVNPYTERIDFMYCDEAKNDYAHGLLSRLPPHPYALARRAFAEALPASGGAAASRAAGSSARGKNQGIIISGVSGAGKTETAKVIMNFLAHTARSDEGSVVVLQQRMLNLIPVLESFGNAMTARNWNSSRFGKLNAMLFDGVGAFVGALVDTFLLEMARVTKEYVQLETVGQDESVIELKCIFKKLFQMEAMLKISFCVPAILESW